MKGESTFKRLLIALGRYCTFFLLVAFVITCCMLLFINTLADSLDVELTHENIGSAAKLTFWNVTLISLIFTVIDSIRRRLTVDIPVKRISEAAERITRGDFSVRVPAIPEFGADGRFNEIIECFNKMAEELSGVETLRTDFIANVSHEMKTPLAVIRNYCTLLEDPTLPPERRTEYARAASDAARRLSEMMTNILKLSRLENQQIYPKAELYDLGEQLCECLLLYESVWESRDIAIETDIAEGVYIRADAELLNHVWSNLLSNAFKFTEEGGTVSLSLTVSDGYATVCVRDTGCGMPPEVGAHIFEKFYQGDSSHSGEGNGLGLALVRRVIDIVQGEISVESVEGEGSRFVVRIAVAENEEI